MKTETKPPTESGEYKNMVDLLAVYSDASNQLARIETKINEDVLSLVDACRSDYAKLQEAATKAEAALELIALGHPEWFTTKKSIKTPYGTIKLTKSTKLEVPNAEVTILLIKQILEKADAESFELAGTVRVQEILDLEALGKCDEAMLLRLRVKQVVTENFTVQAASLDMGKAVKEAVAKEAK